MSQYIILVDARDGGPGITVITKHNDHGDIIDVATFDDISEAADMCKTHPLCKCFPCEIINLDDLGWSD